MPLSPKDLDSAMSDVVDPVCESLCVTIDDGLMTSIPDENGRRVVHFHHDPTYKAAEPHVRVHAMKLVLDAYRKQGWRVEAKDAQRDGPWLEFYVAPSVPGVKEG